MKKKKNIETYYENEVKMEKEFIKEERLEEKQNALNMLFQENPIEKKKDESYKENIKNFSLPNKYYLLEMFKKQKELQEFLKEKGKTGHIPSNAANVRQPDINLSIYHHFCMQVEYEELKVELDQFLNKIDDNNNDKEKSLLEVKFELIDMLFFMFNVGIYTGINFDKVLDCLSNDEEFLIPSIDTIENKEDINNYSLEDLNYCSIKLLNYIQSLPWKAWREYDYEICAKEMAVNNEIKAPNSPIKIYAGAIFMYLKWSSNALSAGVEELYNLYMNKWEENMRRQQDENSDYLLNTSNT